MSKEFEQEIIERFAAVVKKNKAFQVGKVMSVEGNTCTVKPTNGDVEMTGVKNSFVDDPTFIYTPAENSIVVVGLININKMQQVRFIIHCSQYKSVLMKTKDGTVYSLTNTEELITQLNKNNELISAILQVINGTAVLEPGNGVASALQASLKLAIVGKSLGDFSNIKNENIKHA